MRGTGGARGVSVSGTVRDLTVMTGWTGLKIYIKVARTWKTNNAPVQRAGRNVTKRTGRQTHIFFLLFKDLVRRFHCERFIYMDITICKLDRFIRPIVEARIW